MMGSIIIVGKGGTRRLKKLEARIMGRLDVITTALEEAQSAAATEAAQVAAHIARLTDQITALQASIDELVAGQVTQEEIDALAAQASDLSASIDAIDTEGEAPPA